MREMGARFYINIEGVGCHRSGREARAADGYLFHFLRQDQNVWHYFTLWLSMQMQRSGILLRLCLGLLLNRLEVCNSFNGTFKCFIQRSLEGVAGDDRQYTSFPTTDKMIFSSS